VIIAPKGSLLEQLEEES